MPVVYWKKRINDKFILGLKPANLADLDKEVSMLKRWSSQFNFMVSFKNYFFFLNRCLQNASGYERCCATDNIHSQNISFITRAKQAMPN